MRCVSVSNLCVRVWLCMCVCVCVSVVCMYGCVCVCAYGVWSCAKMPDTRKCGEGRSLRDRLLHVPKRTAQTIMRTDGLRVAFGGYTRAHCVCVWVRVCVCVCVSVRVCVCVCVCVCV